MAVNRQFHYKELLAAKTTPTLSINPENKPHKGKKELEREARRKEKEQGSKSV